jgi:vacuolar protein sorting-associated protein 26
LLYDHGNFVKFTALVRELEGAGMAFGGRKTYPFEFSTEKPYETYSGVNVRLRYFIRVTMSRNYGNNFVYEHDFAVENAVPAVRSLNIRAQSLLCHTIS